MEKNLVRLLLHLICCSLGFLFCFNYIYLLECGYLLLCICVKAKGQIAGVPWGFRDQTKVPDFNSAWRLKTKSIFVNSKRTVKQAHRDSEQFQGENHLTVMQNAHISISHALASLDLDQNPTGLGIKLKSLSHEGFAMKAEF